MAAAYLRNATGDTTGGSVVSTSAFTPAPQDLLVVFASLTATTSDLIPPTISSSEGITFGRANRVYWNIGDPNIIGVWIAAALIGTPASMTISLDWGVNTATGASFIVCGVQGMQKVGGSIGLGAEQQSDVDSADIANVPNFANASACNSDNLILTAVAELANPPALTLPTGFTAVGSTGHATPTAGLQVAQRQFGYNGTNLTWGGSSAGAFGALMLEVASGNLISADRPQFMVGTGI